MSLLESCVAGPTISQDVRTTGIEKESKKLWSNRTLWYRLFIYNQSSHLLPSTQGKLLHTASQDTEWVF